MKPSSFAQTGWSSIDITAPAQDKIEAALRKEGALIETLDLTSLETEYHAWRHLGEYEGDYAIYNGKLEHCLLEKTLEHFISLILIKPKSGMTGIDIGSCQSVFPVLVRRIYGVHYYEQDLEYPAGVNGDRIGSSADAIPLPDKSVDFMTLHCTFEHFEGKIDTGFVNECARLLRKGGLCVILPLYLNDSHCNVTGVSDPTGQESISWDTDAQHYCLIPEWQNRFGRHYSPKAFMERVHEPAIAAGLRPRLLKISRWETINPDLWLRWVLVLER